MPEAPFQARNIFEAAVLDFFWTIPQVMHEISGVLTFIPRMAASVMDVAQTVGRAPEVFRFMGGR